MKGISELIQLITYLEQGGIYYAENDAYPSLWKATIIRLTVFCAL